MKQTFNDLTPDEQCNTTATETPALLLVADLLIEKNPETYYAAHLNIIRLGREVCKARKPNCKECPLSEICNYGKAQSI